MILPLFLALSFVLSEYKQRGIRLVIGNGAESGKCVQETNDGGYIVTGKTRITTNFLNFGVDEISVLLAKFNSSGGLSWSKAVGRVEFSHYGVSVQQTDDGGYIVTGISSTNIGCQAVLLTKFNSSGGLSWSKTLDLIDGNGFFEGNSVQETNDGGYIVTGFSSAENSHDNTVVLLAKFTSSGDLSWSRTVGGDEGDEGHSVQQTSDGGYIVTGSTSSFGAGESDVLLVKFSSSGDLSWAKTVGGDGQDNGKSVQQTKDGGYIVTGATANIGAVSSLLLARFDSTGGLLWSKTLEGIEKGNSVQQTSGEGYIVTGITSTIFDEGIVVLVKFDSSGDFSWSKTLAGKGEGNCVRETNDGGFVITGDLSGLLLSKVFPETICCGWEDENGFIVVDNPFSSSIDQELVFGDAGSSNFTTFDASLTEFDITGREINTSVDCPCIGTCFGTASNEPSVCSGHGVCLSPYNCSCLAGYFGDECGSFGCNGTLSNDPSVCSAHGACTSPGNCSCTIIGEYYYYGNDCSYFDCFGVFSSDPSVCSTHGQCISPDNCSCTDDYFGTTTTSTDDVVYINDCSTFYCYGVKNDIESVCSEHGECISPNECDCSEGYKGDEYCETFSCSTCNGRGECTGPEKCICDYGFSGPLCERNDLYLSVMTPVLVSLFCFVVVLGTFYVCGVCCGVCLGCFVLCFCSSFCLCGAYLLRVILKQKSGILKYRKLKNFDLILTEQLLEDDGTVAHLRINKEMFTIPMDEIKVLEMIGSGGSQAIVFKVSWQERILAFKCFKTRLVCENQLVFDGFEKEVSIIASIHHPSIVRFYGCSLEPPRVGILMEYCENGILLDFFESWKENNNRENSSSSFYPINEKLRMVLEISNAMVYLHSRSIMHRDLKCENVLVDELEKTKLMDFGLSKFVDEKTSSHTKRIGTGIYMCPEIINSQGGYDEKCDVYSFGILVFVMITENAKPYGADDYNIEHKVAQNPDLRPSIKRLEGIMDNGGGKLDWIGDFLRRLWDHRPHKRPSFEEIKDILKEKI